MRGDRLHRGVWIGLGLSILMHVGVGFMASTVNMSRGDGPHAGSLDGGVLALNLPDAGMTIPPANDEDLRRLEAMLARNEPPPSPQATPTPPPPPPVLVLGIEDSSHVSDNWLGSPIPTPHSAKLSDVTQPQLDSNPGDPGARSGASAMGPIGPVAPELPPSTADSTPQEKRLRSPEVKAREGESEGGDQAVRGTPKDEHGSEEENAKSRRTTPSPGLEAPHRGNPIREKGPAREDNGPDAKTEKSRQAQPVKAIKPQEGSDGDANENQLGSPLKPGKPGEHTPNTPASPSNTSGKSSPNPGGGGVHAGDKSEKEADASSTQKPIEIRPGQPAAAQGLDITTKRPNFTSLTVVTANPLNPLLRVTFNAKGIVTKVVLLESSGVPDVDDPVINAVYQWKAKGRVLAELTSADPESGITFSVRILLR